MDIRELPAAVEERLAGRFQHEANGVEIQEVVIFNNPGMYELRCVFRLRGSPALHYINADVSDYLHAYRNRELFERVSDEIANRIRIFLRDHEMAQWNLRRDQQLRQQENQRRAAQWRLPTEPIEEELGTIQGFRINTDRTPDIFSNEHIRTEPTPRRQGDIFNSTNMATTYTTATFNTAANATTRYFPPSPTEKTFQVTEDQLKQLLKNVLKENLDIRIVMTESDGEVTSEVEVHFDGMMITSDSDSITL